MFPFSESECDLCDLGIWLLAACLVLVLWYLNWKYEIVERKHRRR